MLLCVFLGGVLLRVLQFASNLLRPFLWVGLCDVACVVVKCDSMTSTFAPEISG